MATGIRSEAVTADEAHALVARLRLIPDTFRTFQWTEVDAWRYFRLKRGLLSLMIECGMPHRRGDCGALRLDDTDLNNVVLHLRRDSWAQASRRFWAAALRRDPALGPARYQVTYWVSCPEPGHPDPCRFQLALPGDRESTVEKLGQTGAKTSVATVEVAIPNDWPELPEPAREWINSTTDELEMMILPYELRGRFDFIRRTGMADCASSARLLLREGQRRGLPVRLAFGFITAPLYSSGHHWVEYRLADRWVPLDPLLVRQLGRWGVLPDGGWDGCRSPGAILGPVCERPRPLALHNGKEIRATLATQALREA